MAKISVIIPVYNSELFLRECLESVQKQTIEDIEIICVDDGSTDSSIQLLEELMSEDPRISLLMQDHQHAGIARNKGLNTATGKYVVFWDSDDFFEENALELLYNRSEEVSSDICICKAWGFDNENDIQAVRNSDIRSEQMPESDTFNYSTNTKYILTCTSSNVWTKMFRREFLLENEIEFSSHLIAEDSYFMWHALCLAESITYINKALVHYRIRSPRSVSNNLQQIDATTAYNAYYEVAKILQAKDKYPTQSFINKVVADIQRSLGKQISISKQIEAVNYIQEYCIPLFGITAQPSDYYYSTDIENAVIHLLNDTPEEFVGYICNFYFRQYSVKSLKYNASKQKIVRLQKKIKKLTKQINAEKKGQP